MSSPLFVFKIGFIIPLLLIGVCVFFVDSYLCWAIYDLSNFQELDWFGKKITDIGDAKYYWVLTLSLLLLGFLDRILISRFYQSLASDLIQRAYSHAQRFGLALLTGGLVVHLLKFFWGRKRPYLHSPPTAFRCDGHHFNFWEWNWEYQSFPSGHSQVIFTVVTYVTLFLMSREFPFRKLIGFVLFVGASFVAFSRVVTFNHFLGDVLLGSLIGFWLTQLIGKRMKNQILWRLDQNERT